MLLLVALDRYSYSVNTVKLEIVTIAQKAHIFDVKTQLLHCYSSIVHKVQRFN